MFSLRGCDINVTLHDLESEVIQSEYRLYDYIEPIHIGADLEAIKRLLHHKQLTYYINDLRSEDLKTLLTVHHSVANIKRILKKVKEETTPPCWWEGIFSTEAGETHAAWFIMLHPIMVLLIIQFLLIFYVIILNVCLCRLKKAKKISKQTPFDISALNALI